MTPKNYQLLINKTNKLIKEIEKIQEELTNDMKTHTETNHRINPTYGNLENANEWYEIAIHRLRLANQNLKTITERK